MLLVSLRITNYKCILDSTEFSVNQLTCLVGKNESGKSAILQALYKLNPVDATDVYNSLYEYPKMYETDYEAGEIKSGDIVITSKWEFTDNDIKKIETKYGSNILNSKNEATISNGYHNQRKWNMDVNFDTLFRGKMSEFQFGEADYLHFSDLSLIEMVRSEISKISSPSTAETNFINWFNQVFKDNDITCFAEKELIEYLPKFMYFSEYQKMPGKVAIDNYVSKASSAMLSSDEKVFEALLALANTTIDELRNATKLEDLINKTRGVSSKISREIFSYWSQNKHLKVDFRCDMAKPGDQAPYNSGYIFSTRIENARHDSSVTFDDRSTGFVWFFSFLVWFFKLQKDNENLFVLLDEPGLTLHAKAQADLLRYFKDKIIPKFQLMYTTHSPFMLDFQDILSARTVEDATDKNDNVLGTKVGSDVLSKDRDTVFPLQAAFGYDITQTLFVGKNILLVEGPSDILYLNYFSNQLAQNKREALNAKWTICPTGGIDKIQSFVSLFSGNSLRIVTLSDYHDGDKRKIDKLRATGILENGHILLASDYTGLASSDIEDIIGTDEYIYLINTRYALTGTDIISPSPDIKGNVLQFVENKMALIKADVPQFNHYAPSEYLINNPSVFDSMDMTDTLNRFEKLFRDVNSLLTD
jgi:predicted ATPase